MAALRISISLSFKLLINTGTAVLSFNLPKIIISFILNFITSEYYKTPRTGCPKFRQVEFNFIPLYDIFPIGKSFAYYSCRISARGRQKSAEFKGGHPRS